MLLPELEKVLLDQVVAMLLLGDWLSHLLLTLKQHFARLAEVKWAPFGEVAVQEFFLLGVFEARWLLMIA